MIRNLLCFIVGAWLGSFFTLAIVALFGKARSAPRPATVGTEVLDTPGLETPVRKELVSHR